MPTNVYFNTGTTAEQLLYENLIIEQLAVFGQDVYYLPRKLVNKDTLFGEDTSSSFNDAYIIEMYLDNLEGYEGQKEMMTRFGIDMQDEATFVVSKRRFEQLISLDANLIVSTRPNEGDLIYFPDGKKLFEISFVDHDDPFYQLDNNPVYKLRCSQFEYSQEVIDTGISVLDNLESDTSTSTSEYQFTLEQSSTYNEDTNINDTTYSEGLLLLNGTDGSSTNEGDNLIMEDETTSAGENIILEQAADTGIVQYLLQETYIIGDRDDSNSLVKDAQNELFDALDDDVLDFSETNPFGDAGGK